MKPLDVLGKQFGKWLVIEKTDKRDSRGQIVWRCKCECGREKGITANQLKFKKTTGCYKCNRRKPVSPRPALFELLKNTTESENGCWIWDGSFTGNPPWEYAVTFFKDNKGKTTHKVGRIILEDILGCCLLKSGFACHRCDNPKCVRPMHLFLGDADKNTKDAILKGRMAFQRPGFNKLPRAIGEAAGRAKLKEFQVLEIQLSKLTNRKLASIYGVGKSTISAIQRSESWAHVKKSVDTTQIMPQ